MHYYKRESQDAEITKLITEYRRLAAFYPAIKKVIREFDHKVYNIRFIKAINDRTGEYFTMDRRGEILTIEKYFSGHTITMAECKTENLIDGKRIDADLLIESLTKKREGLLKKAADFEMQMQKVDIAKQRMLYLEKQLETIRKDFDYIILDTYGINYHIRNY